MTLPWSQAYQLFGLGLPLSALIAAIPMFVLLFLLGVLRKPAWAAALAGLACTFVMAIGAYGMSAKHAVSSAAYGAAFGIFPISWIVIWALVLYQVTVKTGKFEVIKDSIGSITADARLQALLIAFAFGAFLEGCAGFGTPVAVAAAMMAGLGFSPFYAATVCLLANTAPVAFGSIGIPVITLAGITGLPLDRLTADVGRICAPLAFILPAYLIAATSGFSAMREVWPAALVCGAAFAIVQFLVSNFIGAQLTDILSALSALGALIVLLRFWKPRTIRRPHGQDDTASLSSLSNTLRASSGQASVARHTTAEVLHAWLPYGLLVVFVLAWGYQPFQVILNKTSTAVQWPGLHNEIMRTPPVVQAAAKYAALYNLNWLSAAGTACMFAAFTSAIFSRLSLREFGQILVIVAKQLIKPTVTVAAVLAMAFVMNYSGATGTLGLAFSATGVLFPFFSPLMGWLGVFLTGSDTASNALFGSLQVVTATRLGFNPVMIAAANSAGGVMGKMISLQTIAVAAAATGMSVGDQAKLFRFTLRHSILLAVMVGLEVLFYVYVLGLK